MCEENEILFFIYGIIFKHQFPCYFLSLSLFFFNDRKKGLGREGSLVPPDPVIIANQWRVGCASNLDETE